MSLEKINQRHIILASASPRRKQLLEGLGVCFEVVLKEVDEVWPPALSAGEIPDFLCRLKAAAFSEKDLGQKTILITADTVVMLKGVILGKPKDREDAIAILKQLSGEKHRVITAVCLRTLRTIKAFQVTSEVWFREFPEEEIVWYVDHFHPYDKAGAYGVQEWIGYAGIERINGSFYNVMGLPTQRLYLELLELIREEGG